MGIIECGMWMGNNFIDKMGNSQVYEEGKYIIPNKIERKVDNLDGVQIKMENLFGRFDFPSHRADRGEDTILHNEPSVSCIHHYHREEESVVEVVHKPQEKKALTEVSNVVNISVRKKMRFEKVNVPVCHRSESGLEAYGTKKNSPIKHENMTPEHSRVQIFQSRHQSQYFNLKES